MHSAQRIGAIYCHIAEGTGGNTLSVLGPTVEFVSWADDLGGTWHAHRNVSGQPAVDLIITTARLGRFFREVGRPVTGSPEPPAPGDVAQFIAVACRYGYTLGTPGQNAAAGIEMPEFAAG
jgi:hypothetical protein